MSDRWYHLAINPEPWAIGTLGVGRRNGKMFPTMSPNPQLVAYKEAIKGELEGVEPLPQGEYDLHFWFWRKLEQYQTESGRTNTRNSADATNMQKATEDALQGVLFDNDRNVRKVGSTIVEQSMESESTIIVIRARLWSGHDPDEIPSHVWELVDNTVGPRLDYGDWTPAGDTF